jgi:hypothetical protein
MDVKELDSAVSSAGSLLKNLEPILNRAEKWNQGQRLAGAIVSLAVAVLLLSGTVPAPVLMAFALAIVAISLLTIKRRVIEAEVFAVKDKAGRFRAALASDNKHITLLFFDEKTNPLVSLGLTDKGEPNLVFFDPNLKPRALFGIPAGPASPTLHLLGSDGEPYLQFAVSNDNKSIICLGPLTGPNVTVSADDTMQGIVVSDKQKTPRASLYFSEKNAISRLRFHGQKETDVSVELGIYAETIPGLLVDGESGKPAVKLAAKKDGSGTLQLFDCNGELVQHMP